MTAQQLMAKLKNLNNKSNVDINTLLKMYIYERFVERLAISKYKDRFIVKGGFYLTNIFGLDARMTKDIDYSLKSIELTESKIKEVFEEIIKKDINDNAYITLDKIEPIKNEDEYGGCRVHLNVSIDNIKEKFYVDMATGDIITPKAITFEYRKLFDNETIEMLAYNLETVLAEKIETILKKGDVSSRMKDYFDIYLIKVLFFDRINKSNLSKAFKNTFEHRGSIEYLNNYNDILDGIKINNNILKHWRHYCKREGITNNVKFDYIIELIREIIKVICLK